MKNRIRKKRKVPIFGLFTLSFLLIVLLSVIFLWVIVFREYKNWQEVFERDKFEKDYVTLSNNDIKTSVNSKLKAFSESTKSVDFVEITDREFVYLVGESLNSSLPLDITFEKGYVISNESVWDLYVKTNRNGFLLPWLVFRVTKDKTESPEIYISKMSVGNFDFTDYGAKIVIERINKGIRDAILLVNQSDFTGRIFRNIELEKEKMTIKGEK